MEWPFCVWEIVQMYCYAHMVCHANSTRIFYIDGNYSPPLDLDERASRGKNLMNSNCTLKRASMQKKELFSTSPSWVCFESAEKGLNSILRQPQVKAAAPSKPSQENCRQVFCTANQQAKSTGAKLRDLSSRSIGQITSLGAARFPDTANCQPQLRHGPLSRYLSEFHEHLRQLGLSNNTIARVTCDARHFLIGLRHLNFSVELIDDAILFQFRDHQCQCRRFHVSWQEPAHSQGVVVAGTQQHSERRDLPQG